MPEDKVKQRKELRKLISELKATLCGDAKAQSRTKAVNTVLNGGYDLKLLDEKDLTDLWENLFFALWHSEMGRGCEEIIAAIERACFANYKLVKFGFQTIAKKWFGLDQYRVDKVSHLARHLLTILIGQQIKLWVKTYKKRKYLGSKDVFCKQLLFATLKNSGNSQGLCYFMLETLDQIIMKSLDDMYLRLNIIKGRFEFKANLMVFLFKQIIRFASLNQMDARMSKTIEEYVINKLFDDVLPNQPQLSQILVTLRMAQAMRAYSKKKIPKQNSVQLQHWATIMEETHENCINGEYFPASLLPVKDTTVSIKV